MEQTQAHPEMSPEESHSAGVEIPINTNATADAELEALRAALTEAEAEAERSKEVALHVRADMENLRKRLERELDKSRRFALERVLSDLLPVVDSLNASLGSDQASLEQLREGAELILRMMNKVIVDHGLKEIDPLHQPFDPELHQAMSLQPNAELAPNTVVQVFQKGYRLHERLLRPALVVVSKAPE